MRYRFSYSLIIIFFFISFESSLSQEQDNNSFLSFKTVIDDGRDLIQKPLHWDITDWMTLAAIAGTTVAVNQFDEQVRENAIKDLSLHKKPGFAAARLYGDPWANGALAVGLFAYGSIVKNEKYRLIGFEIAECYLYSISITIALKYLSGRYRPFTNNGADRFIPFSYPVPRTSFPSGHTTLAMSLSSVVASNTDNTYLKILCYIPPIFTGTERILEDVHWTSDVLFGAAIGYFVSSYILNKHDSLKKNNTSLNLIPSFDLNGRVGVTLIF